MAGNPLTWNNVNSQVDSYAGAGAVALQAMANAGKTWQDAFTNLGDMYKDVQQDRVNRYLASMYDPNNPLAYNQAINNAISMAGGTGAEFIGKLNNEYRSALNDQIDQDNKRIELDRAKEVQNAIDRAIADANISEAKKANAAMEALNIRSDARTYGDVDPLLNSASQRALQGAKAAQARAATQKLEQEALMQQWRWPTAQMMFNMMGDVDTNTEEGKRVWAGIVKEVIPQFAKVHGISESMAAGIMMGTLKDVQDMKSMGFMPDADAPTKFNLTGSIIDAYGNEADVSVPIDLSKVFEIPEANQAAQQVLASGGTQQQAIQAAQQVAQQVSLQVPTFAKQATAAQQPITPSTFMQAASNKPAVNGLLQNYQSVANTPERKQKTIQEKNQDFLKDTENKVLNPTSILAWTLPIEIQQRNLNDNFLRAQAKQGKDLEQIQLEQEIKKGLPKTERKKLEVSQDLENVTKDYNNIYSAYLELNNAYANLAVDPSSQAKVNAALTRSKAAIGTLRSDVNALTRNSLEAQGGNVNKLVAETTQNVVADVYGFTDTTTESNFSMVPGNDGKPITNDELLSTGSKELIERLTQTKELSETEKETAIDTFDNLANTFYHTLAVNPTNGWDEKADAASKKLALACIAAGIETNSSFKRYLGADTHDYLDSVVYEQADLVLKALNDPNSQIKENLGKFAQLNQQLGMGQQFHDEIRRTSNAAYNAQLNANQYGATPGAVLYQRYLKNSSDRARTNAINNNNTILGTIR